eukprot:1159271-Pelagomonas_calceolata.AAC.5
MYLVFWKPSTVWRSRVVIRPMQNDRRGTFKTHQSRAMSNPDHIFMVMVKTTFSDTWSWSDHIFMVMVMVMQEPRPHFHGHGVYGPRSQEPHGRQEPVLPPLQRGRVQVPHAAVAFRGQLPASSEWVVAEAGFAASM